MHALQIIGCILGGLLIVALAIFLFRQLWNWLIPGIFNNVKRITYIQAFGLLILAKILFGGFPHRGFGRHHFSNCQESAMCGSKHQGFAPWGHSEKETEKPSVKQ